MIPPHQTIQFCECFGSSGIVCGLSLPQKRHFCHVISQYELFLQKSATVEVQNSSVPNSNWIVFYQLRYTSFISTVIEQNAYQKISGASRVSLLIQKGHPVCPINFNSCSRPLQSTENSDQLVSYARTQLTYRYTRDLSIQLRTLCIHNTYIHTYGSRKTILISDNNGVLVVCNYAGIRGMRRNEL